MTSYTSIKTSKFKKGVLKWLKNTKKIKIASSGKHHKIHCNHNGESFPLPLSHREINRYLVKNFARWLEKNEICTKEEFNSHL